MDEDHEVAQWYLLHKSKLDSVTGDINYSYVEITRLLTSVFKVPIDWFEKIETDLFRS